MFWPCEPACSTTLPQLIYPKIVTHPEYQGDLQERIDCYDRFSKIPHDCLKDIKGILVNRPNGVFHMSVCCEDGVLNNRQTLPIDNQEVRKIIEALVYAPDTAKDKRFVYYMLGATGVCVVPLTSFETGLNEFRVTLLECIEDEFVTVFSTIADAIRAYLKS